MPYVRCGIRQALCLTLMAILPAVLSLVIHPSGPPQLASEAPLKEGEVTVEMVKDWNEVLWIDARNQAAYDSGHKEGAILLNEESWQQQVTRVFSTWRPGQRVIVYCDGELCQASHAVAKRLRESGIQPVFVLKGGWKELSGAGRKKEAR
jgi:predicted sulfurtransferase